MQHNGSAGMRVDRLVRQALRMLAACHRRTYACGGPDAAVSHPDPGCTALEMARLTGYRCGDYQRIVMYLCEAGYLQKKPGNRQGYLVTEKLTTATVLDIMIAVGRVPKNYSRVDDKFDERLSQICDMAIEVYKAVLNKFLVINLFPDMVEYPDVSQTRYERAFLKRFLTGNNTITDKDI